VLGGGQSQITGVKIDCAQFANGTGETLEHLVYASKGTKIVGVTPLNFYYWVKVTPTSGPDTAVIKQSVQGPGKQLFIGNGSGVFSLDKGTCTGVSSFVSQNPHSGFVTVRFNKGSNAASSIFIVVNFTTAALTGITVPPAGHNVVYRYGVSTGSSSAVDLVPD
jgi:hypothetical protein